jgi:hypothetical protein
MISWSPDEVERLFALLGIPNRFTEHEKQVFYTTSIVDSGDDVIAFPTPISAVGLNILNLRQILGTNPAHQPAFFDHPWYLEEAFAKQDCEPGWHLRKSGLELPSAIEITLMLFLHYVGTGEQLLQKKHSWCRDEASMNRFVTVGAFGRNGLFISGHPAEFASRGLGICGKLKNA